MAKYNGITTKIHSKTKEKSIMVRFQYLGTIYPVKNFTKLFGCKSETQAYNKLQEIKLLISQGKNPFTKESTDLTINSLWNEWFKRKVASGDWGEVVQKNYTYYYNAHIKLLIGGIRIDKIKFSDIEKVTSKLIGLSAYQRNTFKKLMKPMFAYQIKLGNIESNIFDKLDTVKDKNIGSKTKFETRSKDKPLEILKKLYQCIKQYGRTYKAESIQLQMYMALFTGHRIGELQSLKRKHIDTEEMKILAPASNTKTKDAYVYPLPEEALSYINNMDSEQSIIPISRNSNSGIYKRWAKLANIHTYEGESFTWNDFRRLQMHVMITNCGIDSALADACLEHKPQGIMRHYIGFNYEDKEKAYKKYWNKIREDL